MKTFAALLSLAILQQFPGTVGFAATSPAESCAEVFSEDRAGAVVSLAPTDGLISYLGKLLEEKIIAETDLQNFISKLESGNIVNPITPQQASTNSARTIHYATLQGFI